MRLALLVFLACSTVLAGGAVSGWAAEDGHWHGWLPLIRAALIIVIAAALVTGFLFGWVALAAWAI